MSEATLVLVCKRPAAGIGKQRLAANLGIAMTHQVATALLACALEDVCEWPGPVVIAPASAEDVEWARDLSISIPSAVTIVPQATGNLGQRLNALDQALRAQDMEQLVFIGSDAPGLSAADYAAARSALQRADVALIPARDGGVVLMANRRAWPDLSLLPWSSDRLGSALMDICRVAGQSVKTFGQGYDVDEIDDFLKLTTFLQQDSRPARRALRGLVDTIITTMGISNA
ncbi:DUF2064 domain-containing protein [Nitrosomonas sp. Nm166]|uniref:TIGR04282 family arsenosugar biosynthesis glycosyltransferase n=1 Tax=Nitrosomonas sp. Nm166 TaxID=1881054 RepID=UPI0008E5AABF|nr:DUF2064 domain-containing protein [Nitrosomonas sp. Nm166]SFE39479.1 hypothetical protein SAMN05428977_10158 [Nitrosomonas sp. Nm166]